MIRARSRRVWIGVVLAGCLIAGSFSPVVGAAIPIAIEPRVVDASIEHVSLEKLDVAVRVAVRASHRATIKAVAITDAFVEGVPVSISAPIAGEWQLLPGQDLLLPQTLRVSAYARDAIGTQDLGAIVRQGSVTVRANVEVEVATPWPGRLLFLPSRQTVVKQIVVAVPIATGPSLLQPLTRLGADLAAAVQRVASPFIDAGMNRLPARRALLSRVGGMVATVTTNYTIASGQTRTARSQRAVGFWWTSGVFCTTRDALEPWRFDVADASALQGDGARLEGDAATVGLARAPDIPRWRCRSRPRTPACHRCVSAASMRSPAAPRGGSASAIARTCRTCSACGCATATIPPG